MDYDLELNRAVESILTNKAERVLIQLPDGLKPKAKEIVDFIRANIFNKNLDLIIWSGTNFGACDIPLQVERLGFDLILHFGHNYFVK